MMNFREYVSKPWKAKRADVIKFWQGLRPNLPINPTPVSKQHKGSSFREDTVRITGDSAFINSVISRLKDLLQYDTFPGTHLEVEYRQIESKEGQPVDGPVYVFYVHVAEKKID